MKLIIYAHGFNSSSSSYKARLLQRLICEQGVNVDFWCPDLPHWPEEAVTVLSNKIKIGSIDDVSGPWVRPGVNYRKERRRQSRLRAGAERIRKKFR